jgi:hypothetical protein
VVAVDCQALIHVKKYAVAVPLLDVQALAYMRLVFGQDFIQQEQMVILELFVSAIMLN